MSGTGRAPRRNRIDPWGDLHAVAERGLFTGNRGCLVDGAGEVVRHHRGSNTEGARAAAGRGPTPEESAAADRAKADVDLDKVRQHEQEMTELGANVKGEGQIE